MHPTDEEALQTIDAALFSGDTFHNDEDRIRLREFLSRWQKKVDEIASSKIDGSVQNQDDFDEADRELQFVERDTDDADAPTREIDGFEAANRREQKAMAASSFLDEVMYGNDM